MNVLKSISSSVILFTLTCCSSSPPAAAPVTESTKHAKPHIGELSPPLTAIRPVVDTYFGVDVTDRYRWMEDPKSTEYAAWLSNQEAYARGMLAHVPGRSVLRDDLLAAMKSTDEIVDVRETDLGVFLARKAAGAPSATLYFRPRSSSDEKPIFEPSNAPSVGTSLDSFVPSPDGAFVIILTSSGGTEERTLHVIRTSDAKELPDRVEHLREMEVAWLPNARGFTYTRYPHGADKADPFSRYRNAEVALHLLGRSTDDDRTVFGGASLAGAPEDYPEIVITQGSDIALGLVHHGVARELSIYVKSVSQLSTTGNWRKIAAPEAQITQVAVHRNGLYVLSFRNADRGRILRTRANAPDIAGAATIVPESDDVLEEVRPAGDGIFSLVLRRGVHRLLHIRSDGTRTEAALPAELSVETFWSRPPATSTVMRVESYTESPIWMKWDAERDSAPVALPFNPPSRTFAGVRVERTTATSKDGTRIPITLLLPKGSARDGKQYVWLLGYGAGGYTLSPKFYPFRDAWLKRGGIWALAHVRGGGENGAEWHRAAMKGNKERSIDDFIACAEKILADGYTTSRHLVANGVSAGAMVAGGAMTRRPELFGAVVLTSGATNVLRIDTLPSGAENAKEYGSTTTKDGFEGLLKIDTVQRVRDGVSYPPVLLQVGANDPRLPTWQSGKLTARLQAASSSGRPVLLTVVANQGHQSTTADQYVQRYTDAYAFVFWQLGHPDFQPR
ncbi:prolyl oligopeptidase family serine peptidase [Pendulispora brunnea]|uniref:prolyl oligopeptidase n=1 Tax=Pendulispora brunnea TaxID=2905690 RepID=A0ABZ2K7M3_9BACT